MRTHLFVEDLDLSVTLIGLVRVMSVLSSFGWHISVLFLLQDVNTQEHGFRELSVLKKTKNKTHFGGCSVSNGRYPNLHGIPHRLGAWLVVEHVVRVYPFFFNVLPSGHQRQAAHQEEEEHPGPETPAIKLRLFG